MNSRKLSRQQELGNRLYYRGQLFEFNLIKVKVGCFCFIFILDHKRSINYFIEDSDIITLIVVY